MKDRGFRSEAELVRIGRRLMRSALVNVEHPVRVRYEVPVPGSVPDLVLFAKWNETLQYVVTVEFKVHNWQKALLQAFRHRNCANEAYVAMDQKRVGPAVERLEDFRRANVGLVSLGLDERVAVWHYPEPGLPFSMRFAESLARQLLAPNRTLPPDLVFTRSTRGSVVLTSLREKLGAEAKRLSDPLRSEEYGLEV